MGEFSNPEDYELWMGRWSARLAPAFVSFANLTKGGKFLDVGSGTGILAAALLTGVENAGSSVSNRGGCMWRTAGPVFGTIN